MSQTGTPTEFLQLGITEPDDTLNVLVDLNGQWQKIDTGVKNVDRKANTNASGISALNTAVQDNTENITNILETNVNQQTSIDTLQSKVATLEEDDTSYGSRITAVEAGVQENSELINDLEVDLSGVKTSVGTVPSGSNLQGEIDGLDTRVTALENSGSIAAVEARVTTLETEVGTVPAGETVQGQITTLNGQVNSGNIPFRFSVDGGGNYGYLKADDSFVPFRSGDSHWHELDTNLYRPNINNGYFNSHIVPYNGYATTGSENYRKFHDLINDVDYTVPGTEQISVVGNIFFVRLSTPYLANNGTLTPISGVVGVTKNGSRTYYMTRNNNVLQVNCVDSNGNPVGNSVTYTLHGTPTDAIYFSDYQIMYKYNNTYYNVSYSTSSGTATEHTGSEPYILTVDHYISSGYNEPNQIHYRIESTTGFESVSNKVIFHIAYNDFIISNNGGYWYYL